MSRTLRVQNQKDDVILKGINISDGIIDIKQGE